ncbi:hypothetical protein [Flavobacterium flavipallidum]|uniref:Uncharacterized protein n=1 Tax=Flavobacterium flavipallidum TaxID=3139140 RepID=A0ABU9HNW8_9FLAO
MSKKHKFGEKTGAYFKSFPNAISKGNNLNINHFILEIDLN